MKIVLDTNVLIAAFISKGSCHTLVEQCLTVHSCITSEFILNELRDKLTKKFKYSDEDASTVETLLRSRMRVVKSESLASRVCRDPDDDMVLATAITGKAVCIVTGDRDLLILKRFDKIDIVSPSEVKDYEENFDTEPRPF